MSYNAIGATEIYDSGGVVPPAALLTGTRTLPAAAFQITFTNTPGLDFSLLAATDPTLPATNWSLLGGTVEILPGLYQFTDLQATNNQQQFYRVRWP